MEVLYVLYAAGLIVWAVLVVRAVGDRTVLNIRTLATCAVAGALWGPFLCTASSHVFSMLGLNSGTTESLSSLFIPFLMALLVWWSFFRTGLHRLTSVADAFLVGFMFGFGYDGMAFLFSSTGGGAPILMDSVKFFPPLSRDLPNYAFAPGLYYWLGLATLAAASILRFRRSPVLAIALSAVLLLLAGLDLPPRTDTGVAAITWYRAQLDDSGWLGMAWVALAALIAASIYEGLWVKRVVSPDREMHPLVEEWQALWTLLADGKIRPAMRIKARFRLRRQWELIRAEMHYPPRDPQIEQLSTSLGKEFPGISDSDALLNLASSAPERPRGDHVRWAAVTIGACLVVFVVLYVVPSFETFNHLFYTSPLFHRVWSSTVGVWIDLFLIAFILFSCFRFPAPPPRFREANEALQYREEQGILGLSVVLSALVFSVESPYQLPFDVKSPVFRGFTENADWQLTTAMLLLASAGCSLTWLRQPPAKDQPGIGTLGNRLANSFIAAGGFVVVWVSTRLLMPVSHYLGTAMQTQFIRWFSSGADAARETICLIVAVVLGLIAFRFLVRFSNRLRRSA